MLAVFISKPRTPFFYRATYSGILQLFSFGCESKNIADKHLWDALFVVKYIGSSVSPSNIWAYWCFGLTNHHWNTIDEIYKVKTFASLMT